MDLCQLPGLMTQASRLVKLEPVQHRTRAAGVAAVDNAGILKLKVLYTENIKMVFYHPKYYKELRKRNKSDQAISSKCHDGDCQRAPGPGLKLPGPRPISNANKGLIHRRQASSGKRQASAGGKPQAASLEKQASSPEEQASSLKP